MDVLGHPLTWKTHCFLNTACNDVVYAHTNGNGDFVLFDDLGWPWPVHACYFDQFGNHVGRSRAHAHKPTESIEWDEITPITPEPSGPRNRYGFVGTVTNIELGFVSKSEEFRSLTGAAATEVRRVLNGRTSILTIVTGDGAEFTAFADLKKSNLQFRDIVLCDVKAVYLFNKAVFIVTRLREHSVAENDE